MVQTYRKASIYTINRVIICDVDTVHREEDIVTVVVPAEVTEEMYTDLIITLYDDVYGLLTYKCKLIEFKKSWYGKKYIYSVKLQLMDRLEVIQRRNNIKVKTAIMTEIELVDFNGNSMIEEKSLRPIKIKGEIKDMSASGILFVTKERLNVGQRFIFIFDKCLKPFEITGEILRQQKQNKEYIGYGCQFLDLSVAYESVIRQYVFRIQILEKKSRDQRWLDTETTVMGN